MSGQASDDRVREEDVHVSADWQGLLTEEAAAVQQAEDQFTPAGRSQLRHLARRLLGHLLRPHRRAIIGVLLVALVQVGATMAAPWLVGIAIDRALPAATGGDYAPLALITASLVVCAVLSGALRAVFVLRAGRIGQAVLFDLRRRAFDHVQALSVSFHERFTSGRVISRLTSDIDTLTELLDSGLDGLITAALNIVAIAVLMCLLDLPLAAIALASLIPLTVLYRWFASRAPVAFRRTRETVATLIVNIVETFNGIRAVQAFRRERRNDRLFAGLNDRYQDANAAAFRLHAVFIPGSALIGNIAMVSVLIVGGYRVANGSLDLGVLTAFLLYVRQFYDPMEDVAVFYNSLQSATAALEKIAAVLAEDPAVPEPAKPTALSRPLRGCGRPRRGRVRLPTGPSSSARVRPAHTRRADRGAGRCDRCRQVDYREAHLPFLRPDRRERALGRRRPAADRRDRPARGNRHGHPGRLPVLRIGRRQHRLRPSRRQPRRTSKRLPAPLERTTSSSALPDGYDTDVRKRGGRLSAGQRQLVAFARAFLADPAVLILDEATSSLDVPTERAVQRALRTVLHDRTALIIAHRLSTVEIADRVLVLDDGRIVEDGPPESLIAEAQGEFAQLHASWRDSLV